MYIRNFITLLKRYTSSSLLNIVGMAVAFAAIYLIVVQVKFDLSFNRVIPNSERIYRLEYPSWSNDGSWWATWNRQMPDAMCAACPQVETAGSIDMLYNGMYQDEYSIVRNSTVENLTIGIGGAEPEALAVFPFEFTQGGLDGFTPDDGMIISETVANRFNLSVGDRLTYGRGGKTNAQISVIGIYRDFPKPSTMAMSEGYVCMAEATADDEQNWNTTYYVLLREGASAEEVEKQMYDWLVDDTRKRGLSGKDAELQIARTTPRLTPIADLYYADDTMPESMHGSRTTTYTLIAIAVLILAISFINFVNFFFALIPSRIRAVSNYRIFGVTTAQMRLNFLFETAGLILVSLLVAVALVVLFSGTWLANYISAPVSIGENWIVAGILAVVLLAFGIMVSLYPAWYITRFPPALVIKGDFSASRSGRIMRYALVGIQYTISITLIVCALFIWRQHQYMLSRDMGFDKENLLAVSIPYEAVNAKWNYDTDYSKRDAVLESLKQNPQIKDIALGRGHFVAADQMQWSRQLEDGTHQVFDVYVVSWNFLKVMGIDIVEGRDFLISDDRSETGAMIFNRTAARDLGITTQTRIDGHMEDQTTPVVGICEDFNFQPAQFNINPYAFLVFGKHSWDIPRHAYVRTNAGADIARVREYIRNSIMEMSPDSDPEKIKIKFFDDELEFVYQREDKLSVLVTLFSLLSIVISIIGVFGLVLFETQYSRREIGIRRVYGASVGRILQLFNRKYIQIVAICSAVAIPVSHYIISGWMEQYVYRTSMAWWVYAVAVGAILLITILTVALRSWSAANENPTSSIMH